MLPFRGRIQTGLLLVALWFVVEKVSLRGEDISSSLSATTTVVSLRTTEQAASHSFSIPSNWSAVPCPHSTQAWHRCDLTDRRWGVPVLLLSQGRSGSTVTWDSIASLATPPGCPPQNATEGFGTNPGATQKFFRQIDPEEHGKCTVERILCGRQRENRERMRALGRNQGAGIYGTKWKPYLEAFGTRKSKQMLTWLAAQPHIKIIHNERNVLDTALSRFKHKAAHVPAHCRESSKTCTKRHEAAAQSLVVPLAALMEELDYTEKSMNQTVILLDRFQVARVTVSYEELYYGETTAIWWRVLDYLGVSSKPSVETRADVESHIHHLATSATNSQRQKMANYDEVVAFLAPTHYTKYIYG
jgi:hypothetical protein